MSLDSPRQSVSLSENPGCGGLYSLHPSAIDKPKGFTGYRTMGEAPHTLSVLATIKQRERILLRRGRNRLLSWQLKVLLV